MANYQNLKVLADFFKRVGEYSEEKAMKLINDYLVDPKLAKTLFAPDESVVNDVDEQSKVLYKALGKKRALRAIIETITEYGESSYPRWAATWVYSIYNFHSWAAQTAMEDIEKDLDEDVISKSEARDQREKMDKYMKVLAALEKVTRKMVKREAKIIARKSGVPRDMVTQALRTVPSPSVKSKGGEIVLVSRYRVGYYLNNVLNDLYKEVDSYKEDIQDIDWKEFFKAVFGKDNVVEVASFLLVEGLDRIKDFKTKNVRKLWDSLTSFALNELEHSEAATRAHMIELYIKRVTKMFKNGTFDIRVDLSTLSDKEFPQLTKTVSSYADQLKNALHTKEND